MAKAILIPVLLVIACLFAGAYGMLHNQISYTVSPEYFTQFKFHQFGLTDSALPDRVRAAIVGWHAAWWMGIVIGVVLIPMGLVVPGVGNYFRAMLGVFGVVVVTTLAVGLGALLYASVFVRPDAVGEITRYGNPIEDDRAFLLAGTMHSCSYLGGLIGVITGSVAVFYYRKRSFGMAQEATPDRGVAQ